MLCGGAPLSSASALLTKQFREPQGWRKGSPTTSALTRHVADVGLHVRLPRLLDDNAAVSELLPEALERLRRLVRTWRQPGGGEGGVAHAHPTGHTVSMHDQTGYPSSLTRQGVLAPVPLKNDHSVRLLV